ncbi:MAG: hypothetical protein IKJ26_01610 [Clostridia bacterium]|nr:hypothetical protein [Clostridia bacterium]
MGRCCSCAHQAFHRYISELNSLYLANPALWEADETHEGFQWLDCKSDNKCLFGYTRTAASQTVLAMFNFSDREAEMPPCSGKLLLHTDWRCFGGQTDEPGTKLPPFSGVRVACKN